jgi:hypothetical protein
LQYAQGGTRLCSERLAETGAGDCVATRQVKKLERDNADPAIFRERVAQWRERLSSAGAAGFEVLGAAEKVTAFPEARP